MQLPYVDQFCAVYCRPAVLAVCDALSNEHGLNSSLFPFCLKQHVHCISPLLLTYVGSLLPTAGISAWLIKGNQPYLNAGGVDAWPLDLCHKPF